MFPRPASRLKVAKFICLSEFYLYAKFDEITVARDMCY